eukprot:TRINITY_DN17425_c0_g1_i1.p1 TRINITY_DN17425_c0_g1~~TRINITY_DN17425_c0_g1_i1.p1  ORF type:complete len:243 (+),score=25.40 TRINITY_DN17425_c0_g1_i1:55-783(+)
MGNADSSLRTAPPGGCILIVQPPDMCPTISFDHPRPACVPEVSNGAWQSFDAKVKSCASRMWTEKIQMAILLVVIPIILLFQFGFREMMVEVYEMGFMIQAALAIAALGGTFGMRFFIVNTNEKLDREITDACNTLASATGLHVEYRTEWTGFCRPKHARTFRAVAISPGSAVGAPAGTEVVNCVVPPGAGPGSVIQVAMPSGATVQATVPAGKNAGDTFQVSNAQAPVAPIVVQAVVVESA